MTREEAIRAWDKWMENGYSHSVTPNSMALVMAYNALCGPTREQVERLKGEWIGDNDEKVGTIDGSPLKSATCSVCGNWLVGSDEYDCSGYFCPACGAPMTDEAVDILMKRLERLYGTENQ